MRRIACHYIYTGRVYRLHYVELDEQGRLTGFYPLTEEKAGVAFYNGVLIVLSGEDNGVSADEAVFGWVKDPACCTKEAVFDYLATTGMTDDVRPGGPVRLFLLHGISLASPELGAYDRCGDRYIQRL